MIIKGRIVVHASVVMTATSRLTVTISEGDRKTAQMDGGGFLRGPGDVGGRRVGVGLAEEHGARAADVPVVVVALYGHRGRV